MICLDQLVYLKETASGFWIISNILFSILLIFGPILNIS